MSLFRISNCIYNKWSPNIKTLIGSVLAGWFGLVCVLAASGAFVRPSAAPPIPILIGAAGPLLVFFGLVLSSAAFRRTLRASDPALITALHSWRTGGLGFLALAANGVLPNAFAQPAGWGDIAIGVTAPWLALALARRSGLAGGRQFAAWNILGILDLIIAVSMGVLSSGFVPGMVDGVTTAPMARLPLVVIPAFFVPLYIMLHVTAMIAAQNAARASVTQGSQQAAYGAAAPTA